MFTFGLNVSLIGMGVVFAALILLVCVIKGISRLAAYIETSSVSQRVDALKAPPAAGRGPDRDDEELAAVIVAALAAHTRKP